MIKQLAKTEVDQYCARVLIETDRRYFEMGASSEKLSVGELVWMPSLTDLAASCVVQRLNFSPGPAVNDTWLDEIETALIDRSVRRARIYVDDILTNDVNQLLLGRGYEKRGEIGYLAPKGHPKVPKSFRLCEVRTKDDWQLKLCLHEEAMEGPDGYTNQADLWVEMERRKCETGKMKCFLIRKDDEIVGTVGAIVSDGLLRLKNIVVSPRMRRQGIGVAAVHLLWQMAEAEHGCRLGVFGVEGGKGSKMYQRAGLYEITVQHEWSRLIEVK
jgi:GNAT superfamily N-acetyltransferase